MNTSQDSISSDNDALRWGILLSVQQEKFGINMLDSLTPADEPEVRSLMESRSLSRNDAALIIFERRFGVAPSESNISNGNRDSESGNNNSLTPTSNGRIIHNGNTLSSSSVGEGSGKKNKKKGKVEYTPEGRPMVTSPVQFTPFSSPGGVVQRRTNSSDEDEPQEPPKIINNQDRNSIRASLHQTEIIPPQVSQRVSPRNPYNPNNPAFDDNASHNSSNRYTSDSGSRPGSGRYSTKGSRHRNRAPPEIDANRSTQYDDRYGYIPSPGNREYPYHSPPRHNLNDDSSVVSGGGSISSMRSMNSQFSRSAPALRHHNDEYTNDRYYRDRAHGNGHEPPVGVRGSNLYPPPGNVPDQYPVRKGMFRQPSRQVTHSFMEPRTTEYDQYYEENPAIAAEIAAQRYFAGINNRAVHSYPPPPPSSHYNTVPPLSPARHGRYPHMQAIPEGRPNMRRHGSIHRSIDPNNFMPSPTRGYHQQPEIGESRLFADSSSMSGRYSEAGELRGFGSESFGSSSYSGRHGSSSGRHFRDAQQLDHNIDRVPSQRAVAVPVPDFDDSRPNAEATFGRNIRNEDVHALEGMGFAINKILPALQMYDNNVEAAANYLLENQ